MEIKIISHESFSRDIYLAHTYCTAFSFPVYCSLRMNITIQSFTQLFQGCLKFAKYPNVKRLNLKDYQITARGSDTMPYRNPSFPRSLPWNLSLMIGGTERYVRAFIAGESIGGGSHLIRIASYEPGSDTTCLARITRRTVNLSTDRISLRMGTPRGRRIVNITLNGTSVVAARALRKW